MELPVAHTTIGHVSHQDRCRVWMCATGSCSKVNLGSGWRDVRFPKADHARTQQLPVPLRSQYSESRLRDRGSWPDGTGNSKCAPLDSPPSWRHTVILVLTHEAWSCQWHTQPSDTCLIRIDVVSGCVPLAAARRWTWDLGGGMYAFPKQTTHEPSSCQCRSAPNTPRAACSIEGQGLTALATPSVGLRIRLRLSDIR